MTTYEDVWIDGMGGLRSKSRVLSRDYTYVDELPLWNYDGSSTGQAEGTDSEINLVPRASFNSNNNCSYLPCLVLCDTFLPDGTPCPSNKRHGANIIFDKASKEESWFGLEQEYFICSKETGLPLGYDKNKDQGQYYCSVGTGNAYGRDLVDEHFNVCKQVGIHIAGINSEVAPGQWEFQIGICEGIELGDHLWMARYLLHRLSEKYNYIVDFSPKLLPGKWNGSGCHANFSTKNMRLGSNGKTGLEYINEAVTKLSHKHQEHMAVYGDNNHLRMTGECETASYDVFSDGVANRGASIRRGHGTIQDNCGYFEDRRPASNCDPYLVTSKLVETCCNIEK